VGDRPWLKFYPSDWRSDPKLRMCSLAARGLWIEMLALMHEANPRGHLLVNGIAPNNQQLSVLVGTTADISELISELEAVDVFSRTDSGVIYSRRMTRDEEKSEAAKAHGTLGGNPALRRTVKPGVKGGVKPQIPEARGQSLEEEKSFRTKRSRVSYPTDFEDFWKAYPTDANMAKGEAFKEWQRLSAEDRQAAFASVEAFRFYCKRQPDYRPVHANRYLKQRRFEGHLKAVSEVRQKTKPSVKLLRGSPPFEAWNAYRARRGQPEITKSEWWFDSEWPPGHPNREAA
jgi:hypothetical protein